LRFYLLLFFLPFLLVSELILNLIPLAFEHLVPLPDFTGPRGGSGPHPRGEIATSDGAWTLAGFTFDTLSPLPRPRLALSSPLLY